MRHSHSIELNHKFLILGLTGPLRSGCTTAANFFLAKILQESTKFVEDGNDNIKILYEEMYHAINDHNDDKTLQNIKINLYSQLKKREIKDIIFSKLNKGVITKFVHISMSEMLLKYATEYYLNNKDKIYDTSYSNIISILDDAKLDIKTINIINNLIANKKYRELETHYCEYYDEYLSKIKLIYSELRNKVELSKLGTMLQDIGDNIRKSGIPFKSSGSYGSKNVTLIAEQANSLIKYYRNRQDSDEKRKHHFVIESFRNPYEVEYFRYRYYEFYLMSIYADKEIRQKNRGQFSEDRDNRDSGSSKKVYEIYKQDVTKCVYLSDISINNNYSIEEFYTKLLKYYALILQPGCITPSSHELFMNEAYALSLKSSCISRQVGAVILGKNGYVVGAGWNDAGEGQVGCGYRQIQDIKNISNEMLVTNPPTEKVFRRVLQKDKEQHEPFCFKDEYSKFMLTKKISKFMKERKSEFTDITEEKQQIIENWLIEDITVKRLEYCRALHAEENALLQSSKIGGVGVSGGIIFTTSFPCELCAKKIYQSGIVEIVYTEPYPESISQNVILKDGIKKIKLTQFEGVKSHSYFRLYKSNVDKKEMIEMCKREKDNDSTEPLLF